MEIFDLREIINNAEERVKNTPAASLEPEAVFDRYQANIGNDMGSGYIIKSDNLKAVKALQNSSMMPEAPQLVYMDPPFFTGTRRASIINIETGNKEKGGKIQISRNDFSDSGDFTEYLNDLAARVIAARDMLVEDGMLCIHLDQRTVHYAKLIADAVFGGPEYLINEIVWQYKSGGSTKRRFARKHDTLLLYAKNLKKYKFFPLQEKSYNRGRKPYRFKGVKEYRDEGGWYTLVNMRDVWQIDMVGRSSGERTGYATQKPEALLSRIILSCAEEGDLCVDMNGGSGTMAAVCAKTKRNWISIDDSPIAALYTEKRMASNSAVFSVYREKNLIVNDSVTESDAGEKSVGDPYNIELDFESIDISDTKFLIKINVNNLNMPDAMIPTPDPDKKKVKRLAKADPGSLIAGISVGFPSEKTFRPVATGFAYSSLELLADKRKLKKSPKILIRTVDVFGNTFVKEQDLP